MDLLWINGENFRTLKQPTCCSPVGPNRCPTGAMSIRKSRYGRFSVATEGAESPWGSAQLTFIARRGQTAAAHQPAGPAGLRQSPSGQRNLPAAAGLHRYRPAGQLLIALTDQPAALPRTFAAVTAPAVALSRCCTRPCGGRQDFPSPARMDAMLNRGTLRLSLTFNPLHARQKAASGELPTDSYSFGLPWGPSATSISLPSRLTPALSLAPK